MEEDENPEDFEDEDLKQMENENFLDDQDMDENDNNKDIDNDNDNEIESEIKNNKEKETKEKMEEKKEEPEPDQDDDQDQNEEEDSDDSNTDKRFPDVEPTDWIHWFCKLRGNEFFVEIDQDFLKNEENLIGIKYDKFMKTFLSEKPKNGELTRELLEQLQEIREVYGQIHKRFIFTPLGMGLVREKFLDGIFGFCPRLLCNKQTLLPIGLSEDMRYSQVKVFCPSCQDVYKPRENFYGFQGKKIYKFDFPDGIYFGTSFPQAFLISFPDLDPRLMKCERYIPKLYGFRIFGKYGSKYYTKDQEELDRRLVKYGIKKN